MAVQVTTDIFCDGCSIWSHWSTGSVARINEAKDAARKDGWSFKLTSGKQVCHCPACNGTEPGYWVSYKRDKTKRYRYGIMG